MCVYAQKFSNGEPSKQREKGGYKRKFNGMLPFDTMSSEMQTNLNGLMFIALNTAQHTSCT